jgi:putative transposase
LLPGQSLTPEERQGILDLIAEAKADGLSVKRACDVLGLSSRTIQRWQALVQLLPAQASTAPAVTQSRPHNALTASKTGAIIALVKSPKHADANCRELALALQTDLTPTYVSHVTIWRYERALTCNGPRGRQVSQGQSRTAPDTDWGDAPNQLGDWDITYLHTQEPRVFLYLYSLLDHWSRKNIAWHICPQLTSDEVQTLWDHGLINEALLDQPAHTWPKSLSDQGTQMRSH